MNLFLKKVATPIITAIYLITAGSGGVPFALADPGDETTYYFLTDHLGSVETVLDGR